MFNVTKAAVARVAQELDHLKASTDRVVRFFRQKGAMHLRLSEMNAGDQSFAHQGRVVLVVDSGLAEQLGQRTLDVKETTNGTKLCLAPAA
jgi:hypothetical protein